MNSRCVPRTQLELGVGQQANDSLELKIHKQ